MNVQRKHIAWLVVWIFLILPATVYGQSQETVAITTLSNLDYNDGGGVVISQNQGDVTKYLTDNYIAKFEISVETAIKSQILSVTITAPTTPFPYEMDVATNVNGDDAQSACVVPPSLDICVPSQDTSPTYTAYVYVYGTVTVGDLSSQQYSYDITAEATFTNTECDPAISPC